MHAALRSPSPSKSPLVTLRQKRRRSLKKIKVIYGLDMDVDKAPDNPKNVEPDSETITNVESSKISSPDTTVSRKEVGSPKLERGVVNAALGLYDVIQLDFFSANMSPKNNQWVPRPPLYWKSIQVPGDSINDKVFAVGEGKGCQISSDVEYLDLNIGKWLPIHSMNDKFILLISGTRKKQKVMLKCGVHKLSDVLFVKYVFLEAVATKAAGIELSHDMFDSCLVVIIYVRPGNGSCPRTMDLIQSSLFRRYVGDMPERVFHKEEACKQLVKLFIKVKLLPDHIQKEAALWVAFKPK
ncbi:hypothetical protein L2E82_01500 [Cichorium intybus]|uniref:Uncharacterized protein n=1 Tax=Cichorium intybus TaxID=13427 RepID=A0ACB9H187_CICIN|nr:hypothetical protein L2E82_01500 [Cichorium intybus]